MQRFQRILVGVDLSSNDRLVGSEPYGPSAEAVRCSLWLAKQTRAEVHFIYSLDAAAATERLIEEHRAEQPNIFDEATRSLNMLVERAEAAGVVATFRVTMGPSWLQLIREVITGEHDLVIVGTRGPGRLQRVLIGSTAMKLLRKCPCPVWVTRPPRPNLSHAVLVAHDLTDVGRQALTLGASVAEMTAGPLHVLHAVQLAGFDERFPGGIEYEVLQQMMAAAKQQLADDSVGLSLTNRPKIHVAAGRPSNVILEAVDQHQIELVVMGTVARTGVRGLVMGNTAEHLLPLLPCSVLALKPQGFECPMDVFQID